MPIGVEIYVKNAKNWALLDVSLPQTGSQYLVKNTPAEPFTIKNRSSQSLEVYVQLINLIREVFNQPPVPFDPAKSTLKTWIMFCLRDRGFKLVYAERGDFAVEMRRGEKVYFRIAESTDDLDSAMNWIVRDPTTNKIDVVAAQV